MTINDLHPSFRKAYGGLPAFKLDQFWSCQFVYLFQYVLFRPVRDDRVDVKSCQVGRESVRIHTPRRKLTGGGLLWIHGGGGLAAALCQRILDSGGTQPIAQCSYCPMLDDRTAARRELDTIEHIGWPNRNNRYGWNSYLGRVYGPHEATPNWAVPGCRKALAGLPPTWIDVGDADLFFEENLDYAKRLRECNVPCELEVVEEAHMAFK